MYGENSPTPWCANLQTSLLLWCFWGDEQCHLSSKHVVYYGIKRVQFWSHLTRLYSPSIWKACPNIVQPTLNKPQYVFPSAMESCMVSIHTGHGGVHYLYLLIPCLPEALQKWSLSLLTIIFTPQSYIFWVAPGRGLFMVEWCSSRLWPQQYWNIQKFRNPSVASAISMFCNNVVAKVLRDLYTNHATMRCFLCEILVMGYFFTGHQFKLNQLILICANKGQDCFQITDRFHLVSWLSMPLCTCLSSCVWLFFSCVISNSWQRVFHKGERIL